MGRAKAGGVVFPKTWNGMDEDMMIDALFYKYDRFKDDDIEYELFPDVNDIEYNSNGFINGILRASNMAISQPLNNLTGWNHPVPNNKFQ